MFFFSQEKFEPYTHTQFQRAEKKQVGKTKTPIFTNTHDFFKKVVIFKLFPGKKNTVPLIKHTNRITDRILNFERQLIFI